MELSFFQGRQFQVDSASKYSSSVPSQTDIQKKSAKKLMSFGSGGVGPSSRKRIRRQNSIQESITNYFKENKTKVASFLDINQQVIHLIHPSNLIFPQLFKIMEDGLYILIRGGIKMITFNDEKPPYRSMCRQIINNAFRMMKNHKDLGMKVLENGSVIYGKQLQKKNYYRNNSKGKNQVEHSVYTVTKAFSVIQCVNQNCLNFSPQTILYRIQEDDAKQFCFKQKKQELYSLIKKNNHLIKNHTMLHHNIQTKVYNFRNFIEFDNVAIIKKGYVKVTKKEKFNPDFIKQSIQYQKIVCQLSEGSLLVPEFYYEVASSEAQIVEIDLNDSFKLLKLPEWVTAFIAQQQCSKNEPLQITKPKLKLSKKQLNILQNEQIILGRKKPIVKKSKQGKTTSLKETQLSIQNSYSTTPATSNSTMPSLLVPLISYSPSPSHFLKQKFLDYLPNNQKLRKIKFKFQNQKKAEAVNSIKLAYQIVDTQSANNNPNHANGQINNKRTKQKLFFKAMSPYIIISEKIGIKEMLKTQQILRKKPKDLDDNQNDKKKAAKLQKLRSIQYNRTRQANQRKSWQGRSIQKMTRYLSKENQDQYEKQSKQNEKRLIQGHKKSYSQFSTFYGDSVLNKCRQRGIFKQLSKLNFNKS